MKSDSAVVSQEEHAPVEPPDTTATADALGGMANLPPVNYDPTTHLDDVQKPTGA
ncbi:MAG: hypothetical protein M3Y28_08455 [Armatimonadota bacterium]|nr:hypothetical protein [Armatimonadota bacterium]